MSNNKNFIDLERKEDKEFRVETKNKIEKISIYFTGGN